MRTCSGLLGFSEGGEGGRKERRGGEGRGEDRRRGEGERGEGRTEGEGRGEEGRMRRVRQKRKRGRD